MDPIITGALISGGLNLLGAERANRQTVDLSNTAYQRAMADMRKAGLNPILAGKLGGASTPVMQNVAQAATQGYTSTMQAHSGKELQSAQAAQAYTQAGLNQITTQIKALKDVPDAKLQGFIPRIVSKFTDAIEGIVKEHKGGPTDNVKKAIFSVLDEAYATSDKLFGAMLNGMSDMSDAAKEVVAEVFTLEGQSVEKVTKSGLPSHIEAKKTNGLMQRLYDWGKAQFFK